MPEELPGRHLPQCCHIKRAEMGDEAMGVVAMGGTEEEEPAPYTLIGTGRHKRFLGVFHAILAFLVVGLAHA